MILMQKLIKIIDEIENKPAYNNMILQFPSLVEEYEMKRIKDLVVSNLDVIEQEIDMLFFSYIQNCNSVDEAKVYFNILQKIQEILAMLFFKEEIAISDKLKMFIRDCERLDDDWLRNSLFDVIKKGTYSYNFMELE